MGIFVLIRHKFSSEIINLFEIRQQMIKRKQTMIDIISPVENLRFYERFFKYFYREDDLSLYMDADGANNIHMKDLDRTHF